MPQRFRVHQKMLTLKRVKLHSLDDIHMYKRDIKIQSYSL